MHHNLSWIKKPVKTLHHLRTTMTNERLNGLALLSDYNDTSYIYQQQQN